MAQIVVPLDGSLLAERALPLAATLAGKLGDELRLMETVNLPVEEALMGPWAELEAGSGEYLTLEADRLARERGIGVTTVTRLGPPAPFIVREASSPDACCIVMTTHGREGLRRAVLGSVAEHVLREAPVPVFLLPAAAEGCENAPIKRIAVALDGSSLAELILEPVARLARRLEAAVTLVRLYIEPEGAIFDGNGSMVRSIDQEIQRIELLAEEFMAPLAERFRSFGVDADYSGAIGSHPAEAILRLAAAARADLIAMATHGRSGLDRLRHGSVTEDVLRHSHLPVLGFGRGALEQLQQAQSRFEAEAVTTP
jgi:nucleotide-binding universal stress UspA family protein